MCRAHACGQKEEHDFMDGFAACLRWGTGAACACMVLSESSWCLPLISLLLTEGQALGSLEPAVRARTLRRRRGNARTHGHTGHTCMNKAVTKATSADKNKGRRLLVHQQSVHARVCTSMVLQARADILRLLLLVASDSTCNRDLEPGLISNDWPRVFIPVPKQVTKAPPFLRHLFLFLFLNLLRRSGEHATNLGGEWCDLTIDTDSG